MKSLLKITLLVFVSAIIFTACKKEPKHDGFTITGHVKGFNSGWAKLIKPMMLLGDKRTILDSTEIKNGRFTFKGKVNNIDYVEINISPRSSTYFFLENSSISIEMDTTTAEKDNGYIKPLVSGSKTQTLFEEQKIKLDSIKNQEKYVIFKTYRNEVAKAKKSNDKDLIEKVKAKMTALGLLETELEQELKNYKIQFIKNHPNSPVSVHILGFTFSEIVMTKEELKTVYNLLQGDAKKTQKFRVIDKTFTDIFAFEVGSTAPDFTLKTLKGDNLTLSEVKGNYVLVDFWASWCIPCRASFPHLKTLYTKYKKDGFNVVAVASSDKNEKWRKAIEEDQTVWNHVFDSKSKENISSLYGVQFLPTTFLLDRNQKIILRNASKKELDAKLKELYGY